MPFVFVVLSNNYYINKISLKVSFESDRKEDELGAKLVPVFMEKAHQKGVNVILPLDFVSAELTDEKSTISIISAKDAVEKHKLVCRPLFRQRAPILECRFKCLKK